MISDLAVAVSSQLMCEYSRCEWFLSAQLQQWRYFRQVAVQCEDLRVQDPTLNPQQGSRSMDMIFPRREVATSVISTCSHLTSPLFEAKFWNQERKCKNAFWYQLSSVLVKVGGICSFLGKRVTPQSWRQTAKSKSDLHQMTCRQRLIMLLMAVSQGSDPLRSSCTTWVQVAAGAFRLDVMTWSNSSKSKSMYTCTVKGQWVPHATIWITAAERMIWTSYL